MGCEGGASAPSAPPSAELGKEDERASGYERESGVSLVEVVLAGALLMTVLMPSAALLRNSDSVLGLNKAKVVAANLAGGQLEADRAAADDGTWSSDVPSLATPSSSVQVPNGGETYAVSQVSGWCAEDSSGTWTNYTSNDPPPSTSPAAYLVKVTVSWLGGTQSVWAAATLTTPSSVTAPASGTCPS